jgi:hypothetical protein
VLVVPLCRVSDEIFEIWLHFLPIFPLKNTEKCLGSSASLRARLLWVDLGLALTVKAVPPAKDPQIDGNFSTLS